MAASEGSGQRSGNGVARRLWPPVALFFVVALLAAGVLQPVAGWVGFHPQAWGLVQFGPSIAVLVVLWVFPSLRGLLAATFAGRRAAALRQLVQVSGTIALVFLGYIEGCAVLGRQLAVLPLRDLTAALLAVAPLAVLGACGEELGWRCLLQPLLRRRYSAVVASTAVGLLWTAWHVPVFSRGIAVAGAFLLSGVAMSVIMGLAIERSGGHNLLIAGAAHGLANLGGLVLRGDGMGNGGREGRFQAGRWPSARGSRVGLRPRHRGNRAVTPPGIARALLASAVAVGLVSPVGAAVLAAPAAAAVPAGVGQQIREQLRAAHVPAAAYAVLDGGRVHAGGWGPGVDGDTPFVLGSISKTFTVLAVMQLVDRGVVDLDAPVTRYLPGFRTAEAVAVITVRQLLAQTSGLPTSAGLDLYNDPHLSLRQRVAGAAEVELVSRPGEAFHYCNLNYATLGYLVEQVSGQSFGDYVTDNVFAPLGMTHSHVRLADALADGMPQGALVWFGLNVRHDGNWSDGALADGDLISTARDMAGYLQFQLGDGTYRGRRIVSEAGLRLMHASAVRTPPDAAAEFTDRYGLGWGIGSVGRRELLAHDGDETGYHANVGLLPQTGQGIVVLTARNGFFTDPSSAYRAGLQALAGMPAAAGAGPAFVRAYAVIDAVALLTVAAMALSLLRRRRWAASLPNKAARRGRWAALAPTVVLDVVLAVALYLAVFVGVGTLLAGFPLTVPVLYGSTPDLTCLVLLGIAFFLLKAFLDLCLGCTVLRRATGRSSTRVDTSDLALRRSAP